MNIGERIKQLRKKSKITTDELAEKVGVNRATIYRYENGDIEKFPISLVEPIADVLKTTPEYLMGWDESADILDVYYPLEESRRKHVVKFAKHQLNEQNGLIEETGPIYHVGLTAAGPPLEYSQIPPEQMTAEIPHGAEFALTVKGDSMEPLIKNGSIIFFKEQPTVENGEIAIVEIDGNAVTCKKFYYDGSKAVLRSINPKYPDLEYNEGVRIIGKVIL